jgi:glycosyltransferase involved in cell wall biosynthesis
MKLEPPRLPLSIGEPMSLHLTLIGPYPVGRPPAGGVESVNRALVELLLERVPGSRIHVLTVGKGEQEKLHNGRLHVSALMPENYSMARLRGFPKEREVIDTFMGTLPKNTIVHSTGPISLHVVNAAKRHNLPVALTIHGVLERDVLFEKQMNPLQRKIAALQLRSSFGAALRTADYVIAISSYSAEYAHDVGRTGGTVVIPNPLDKRFEGPIHKLHPDAQTVLFVGNLQPRKGVHNLLEAFARAAETRPGMKLRIAGPAVDPAYAEQLKVRVAQHGLESRVSFLGPQPKERVLEEMLAADLLVLPSGEENLPQVLQEAGAIGLPFIATNVGGVKDLVPPEHERAMLVGHGDEVTLSYQIGELLDEPDRRSEISQALRAHIGQGFSNDSVMARTLEVYERLSGRGSSVRPPVMVGK